MDQIDISTLEEFENFIKMNPASVVYFSTPECNVCKVFKPKLKELLQEEFPEFKFAYVNCEVSKELAAQKMVFAVPTILFFFDGREFLRKSRNVNLQQLSEELAHTYNLYFS